MAHIGTLIHCGFFFQIYFKCPIVNAVRNISLIVQKSECFGLLGLDGAGKSTTFKMITGKETTTSGVVLIDGINIIENIWKVFLICLLNWCPKGEVVSK